MPLCSRLRRRPAPGLRAPRYQESARRERRSSERITAAMVNMNGYQMGRSLAKPVVILTTVGTVTPMCPTVACACIMAATIITANPRDVLNLGKQFWRGVAEKSPAPVVPMWSGSATIRGPAGGQISRVILCPAQGPTSLSEESATRRASGISSTAPADGAGNLPSRSTPAASSAVKGLAKRKP